MHNIINGKRMNAGMLNIIMMMIAMMLMMLYDSWSMNSAFQLVFRLSLNKVKKFTKLPANLAYFNSYDAELVRVCHLVVHVTLFTTIQGLDRKPTLLCFSTPSTWKWKLYLVH
uniref:Uncharacterized protein n=1 Tax=Glossina brevipalpis TaxID=37001 RepID=A0A1A9WWT7_9MUSC